MKKIIFLLTCVTLMFSCSTDNNIETVYDSNSVQKALGKETNFNTYMRIDRISKDLPIAKELLKNVDYDLEKLNLDDIKKVDYGWGEDFVFEIPLKNSDAKRLSIYKINNIYLTTVVEISTISSEIKRVKVNLPKDDLLLYSFDMVNGEKIIDFFPVNLFPLETITSDHKYDKMEDCGKYKMADCMECGLDVCAQDWRCGVAAIVSGPAFVAGLAITCGARQITG